MRLPRWGASAPSTAPVIEGLDDIAHKPSIAVPPFVNMSDDKSQEYFADGMTEDIITGLSCDSRLFVVSRNSTFIYKGKAVDSRAVDKELGVRYVLEGSIRPIGERLRITRAVNRNQQRRPCLGGQDRPPGGGSVRHHG